MIVRSLLALVLIALTTSLPGALHAEPTAVSVRVLSKGAKFIASSMGGAEVVIRNAETGEILAKGVTAGSTGDTERIMRQRHGRLGRLSSEDAAVFRAELAIDTPTRIEVRATGPMAQRQAANTVSATQWLMPGRDLTGGDGLLLEMPGLVVDALAPPAHVSVPVGEPVELAANVTMMCGCPLTPGGLWDSETFEIAAVITHKGEEVARQRLGFAGTASQFAGSYTPDAPGLYQVTVYGYQEKTGNTGLDRTTFIAR